MQSIQFTVMHRDIELNRIDDMVIVTEPNHKIGVVHTPTVAYLYCSPIIYS